MLTCKEAIRNKGANSFKDSARKIKGGLGLNSLTSDLTYYPWPSPLFGFVIY